MALPLFYLFKLFITCPPLSQNTNRRASAISFIHILYMAYNNSISDNLKELISNVYCCTQYTKDILSLGRRKSIQ